MATANKPLSTADTWFKLTNAGEDASIWLHKRPSQGKVIIDHTDAEGAATLPSSNTNVAENKSFALREDGLEEKIFADNANDVYYGRCIPVADSEVVVDAG
jgi:hypothetical protein